MQAAPGPTPPGTWTRRRRIIHWSLLFCAFFLVYLVERRPDAAVTLTLAPAIVAGALGIITSYVFGAVVDDRNARSAGQ